LFLDLDGPLLDVSARYYRAYRQIIARRGGRPIFPIRYWRLKRKKMPIADLLALSAIALSQAEFRRQWLGLIERKELLCADRIWPGAKAILAALGKRYCLVLVSLRHSRSNLIWQLKRLGLGGYFFRVLSAAPEVNSWRVKCRLIKGTVGAGAGSYLIGDSEVDVLAGKALGLPVVAVHCGVRDKAFLAKLRPEYLASSLRQAAKILP
jgi:phosphoglycolate phosphatase-like HAD superfamily hydrolase